LFRLQSSGDNDEAMLNQPTPDSKESLTISSLAENGNILQNANNSLQLSLD